MKQSSCCRQRPVCGPHRIFAAIAAVAICGLILWGTSRSTGIPHASTSLLAADETLKWYRGNLHTHTHWSDGDDYPEMVALWYSEHNYDFLAFTDHNTLLDKERWIDVAKSKGGEKAFERLKTRFPDGWVQERSSDAGRVETRLKMFSEVSAKLSLPGRFLLMQGEEVSDKFGSIPIHMNATNLNQLAEPRGGESVYDVMQRNTDALLAQRQRSRQPMLIHLNHPNFHYAITAEDLMRVRGDNFFEVYNGHPSVNNDGDVTHASSERLWDIILTHRLAELDLPLMYGLATDDGHNYHNIPSRAAEPGRGWVMVLAHELTAAALIGALESGRFYASSGVLLEHVAVTTDKIDIRVRPAEGVEYTIEFIGTRRGYNRESEPVLDANGEPLNVTRRYSSDIGQVLQTVAGPAAQYRFTPADIYVRARITSTRTHPNPSTPDELERAWCQPAKGPAARP